MTSPSEVTQLLVNWSNGDRAALDDLLPFIHEELRRLARHYMRAERPDHTLQATALINEAYLRLVDQQVPWQNRAHFFGISACLMRQILVDHARGHRSRKLARDAALKALERDESLAEGYTALAIVLSDFEWDRAGAEREFARAVELNPNYATARHWRGLFLAEAGRFDESLAELRKARDLDPVSSSITKRARHSPLLRGPPRRGRGRVQAGDRD